MEIAKFRGSGVSIHSPNNIDDELKYEITIKSAKGLPNVSDYLKHNGLVKIGGPKTMGEDEIDAGEEIVTLADKLRYREANPYRTNEVKIS